MRAMEIDIKFWKGPGYTDLPMNVPLPPEEQNPKEMY